MKYSEFWRWLKAQGVTFEPGKGSHFIARHKGGQPVVVPFHGAKEIKEPLRKSIIKALGLK